jgi:hypothetical protein
MEEALTSHANDNGKLHVDSKSSDDDIYTKHQAAQQTQERIADVILMSVLDQVLCEKSESEVACDSVQSAPLVTAAGRELDLLDHVSTASSVCVSQLVKQCVDAIPMSISDDDLERVIAKARPSQALLDTLTEGEQSRVFLISDAMSFLLHKAHDTRTRIRQERSLKSLVASRRSLVSYLRDAWNSQKGQAIKQVCGDVEHVWHNTQTRVPDLTSMSDAIFTDALDGAIRDIVTSLRMRK